ncbi:Zinc finger protein, partial [Pseudolycoriella hygida]
MMVVIKKMSKNLSRFVKYADEDFDEIRRLLPVKRVEFLDSFDQRITDDTDFRRKVLLYLRGFKGSGIPNDFTSVMRKIMDDEVLYLFNLKGIMNKRSLENYKFMDIIHGQFCDVIIKLNNGFSIPCHFCVIASQSLFVGNNRDVTLLGDHYEHVKLLIKILRIDNALELRQFFDLESEAINAEDITLKVKQRRINAGFQYKTQQTQPAQSKKHSCNGCNFKCYRPSEMLIHINNCKSDNKKCSLCEATFETMTEFKCHLVRHDNDKPFFCNECGVRFVTKTALNLHSPKHSNTTNHMCPFCGKGFKWKHGLNNHLIVHSTEKKLLCDECGYSTNHLKTLRAHQLTHGGQDFR